MLWTPYGLLVLLLKDVGIVENFALPVPSKNLSRNVHITVVANTNSPPMQPDDLKKVHNPK